MFLFLILRASPFLTLPRNVWLSFIKSSGGLVSAIYKALRRSMEYCSSWGVMNVIAVPRLPPLPVLPIL